jgi:hypothetical protein
MTPDELLNKKTDDFLGYIKNCQQFKDFRDKVVRDYKDGKIPMREFDIYYDFRDRQFHFGQHYPLSGFRIYNLWYGDPDGKYVI